MYIEFSWRRYDQKRAMIHQRERRRGPCLDFRTLLVTYGVDRLWVSGPMWMMDFRSLSDNLPVREARAFYFGRVSMPEKYIFYLVYASLARYNTVFVPKSKPILTIKLE